MISYGDITYLAHYQWPNKWYQWPSGDQAALSEFYFSVNDCLETLKQLNCASDLFSSDTLRQAVKRLPVRMHNKWAEFCLSMRQRGQEPSLVNLENWVLSRVLAQKDLPEQSSSENAGC